MSRGRWAWPAAIAAFAGALHVLPLDLGAARYGQPILNAGHVVAFALLAFVTALAQRPAAAADTRSALRPYLVAAALAIAAAVAFEAVQIRISRDASLADLFRDGAGIVAGLLVAAALRHRPRSAWFLAGAAAMLVGLASPTARLLITLRADIRFPILLDFESRADLSLVATDAASVAIVPAPSQWNEGGRVLRVSPSGRARYHSITVAVAPNWTAYESLRFDVSADRGTAAALFVRINDAHHDGDFDDRYNARIPLSDEPVDVSLPLADVRAAPRNRRMDLERVTQLTLFVDGATAPVFYLDNLRLE